MERGDLKWAIVVRVEGQRWGLQELSRVQVQEAVAVVLCRRKALDRLSNHLIRFRKTLIRVVRAVPGRPLLLEF